MLPLPPSPSRPPSAPRFQPPPPPPRPAFVPLARASAPALLLLAACAAAPAHPRAVEQVERGYRHLAAGDRERAEVAFEHALEMAPDLAEARNGLGVALRAGGRPSEALVQYDHALSVDPDLAEAHVNRGETLAALGLEDEAERALGEALRIDPDQVPARIDRARLLARSATRASGAERDLLLERARRDLLHALEARPALADVHLDLGWVCWLRGDTLGAAESYEEAARLEPGILAARVGACAARAFLPDATAATAACASCLAAAPPGSSAALRCEALLALREEAGRERGAEGNEKGAPAVADAPR